MEEEAITVTGILELSADGYHADSVSARPSLSASIAAVLCTRSPLHAWTAHPKLNPHFERTEDAKFDVGKAAHSVLLEGEDVVYIVHEPDWRKTVAKEAREYARSLGKVPLLSHHRDEVYAMVEVVRVQLAAHRADPPLFTDGKPEQTLVWQEGDVTCRARLDWLRDDMRCIDDLKTTSRSADPAAFTRNLYSTGADVQAAFYQRGLRVCADAPTGAVFRWCVVETSPPYALSVVSPGPDVLALAEAKVDRAIALWRECLANDSWPGYPTEVCYAELPAWEESRWLEKEAREAA